MSEQLLKITNSIYENIIVNGSEKKLSHIGKSYQDFGVYIKCSCPCSKNHKNNDSTPSFVAYKDSTFGKCFACGFSIDNVSYAIKYLNIPRYKIGTAMEAEYKASVIGEAIFKWAQNNLIKKKTIAGEYLNKRGFASDNFRIHDVGSFDGNIDTLEKELVSKGIEQKLIDIVIHGKKKDVEVGKKATGINWALRDKNLLITFLRNPDTGTIVSAKARKLHEVFSFKERENIPPRMLDDYDDFKKSKKLLTLSIEKYVRLAMSKDGTIMTHKIKQAFGVMDMIKNQAYSNGLMSEIILVEGEMDSMRPKEAWVQKMTNEGISLEDSAMAYPHTMIALGTTSNKWALSSSKSKTGKLILALDNDSAGEKGTMAIAKSISDRNVYYAVYPSGVKDLDELIELSGVDAINTVTKNARPIVEFYSSFLNKEFQFAEESISGEDSKYRRTEANREIFIDFASGIYNEMVRYDLCIKYYESLGYRNESMLASVIAQKISDKDSGGTPSLIREVNGETFEVIGTNKKTGAEALRKIANFQLHITNNVMDDEQGIMRELYLDGKGEKSENMVLSSDILCSVARFKTACMKTGSFVFMGNDSSLSKLMESKILFSSSKLIHRTKKVGYIEEHDLFLFGDCAIKDGIIIPKAKDSDVVWTGSDTGVAIQNIGQGLPMVLAEWEGCVVDGIQKTRKVIKYANSVPKIMHDSVDGGLDTSFNSMLGIGWCMSCFYKDMITEKFEGFPFLFLSGRTLSGKTSFAKLLMQCFGFEKNSGTDMGQTTMASIHRSGSYYSNLPVWLEEFSNETKDSGFMTMLKSRYSNQGVTKASITANSDVVKTEVNATTILSGEHLPSDEAVKSRCLITHISASTRNKNSHNSYITCQEEARKFSAIAIKGALLRNKKNEKQLYKNILKRTQEYMKLGVPDRIAKSYAASVESYIMFFDYKKEEFITHIDSKMSSEAMAMKESSDVVSSFYSQIGILLSDSKSSLGADCISIDIQNQTISLKIDNIIAEWIKFRKQLSQKSFSEEDIKDMLYEEPYIIRGRYGGPEGRCVFLTKTRTGAYGSMSHGHGVKLSTKNKGIMPSGIERMLLSTFSGKDVDALMRDSSKEVQSLEDAVK